MQKFKVGDHWWIKNGKALMLIISKTDKKLLTKQVFPIVKKNGNKHTFEYTLVGKYPESDCDKFDLIKKETDKRKILKTHLGLKETR